MSSTHPAPAAKITSALTIIASLRATAARFLAKAGISSHAGMQEIQDAADILENIAPPEPMAIAPAEKCYSLDGESYNYTDRAEALTTLGDSSADGLQAGMTYHAGDSRQRAPSFYFSMSNLVENMGEAAYDDAGEFADGFPDMTKEKEAELNAIICNWLDRNVDVSFFTVENAETVEVTEQDVADFGEPLPAADALQASAPDTITPILTASAQQESAAAAATAEAAGSTLEVAPHTTNPFPQPEPITRL